MTDQTPPKPPRGRPFAPRTSGNPAGRPRGSRNRATLLWEQMSEAEAEDIIRIVLELALSGDKTMLKECLGRLAPRARERLVSIELPPVTSAADRAAAIDAIRRAQAAGDITLSEAEGMARLVDLQIEAIETSDFARQADELLQMSRSRLARLAPKASEPSPGDDGGPVTDVIGAPAANDGAPEIAADGMSTANFELTKDNGAEGNAATDCAAEPENLKNGDSPSANGAVLTTDVGTAEHSGTSTEGDLANENSAEYQQPSKRNDASAPDDGEWHDAAD